MYNFDLWRIDLLIINSEYRFVSGKNIVTIGKFDGLHLGHKKIIDEVMKNRSSELGSNQSTVVASFVDHPDTLLKKDYVGTLLDRSQKINKLENLGVDYYCELPFDKKMMNTEAEDFFEEFIVSKWKTGILVVGDDFTIGRNRRGDISLLNKLCCLHNIKMIVVPRLEYKGAPVSSSRIKNELIEGNVREAEYMLGYEYSFEGIVIEGNHLGRTIGLPTVNIKPEDGVLLPKFGVYGSLLDIFGITYKGITNIGVKPTVEEKKIPLVETNIINFDGNLYGETLKVRLKTFVRPEMKFNGLDELKNQIETDKNSWTNMN